MKTPMGDFFSIVFFLSLAVLILWVIGKEVKNNINSKKSIKS